MRPLAATVPALLLAGCEMAAMPSANWEAKLDALPDPHCVRAAIDTAPGLAAVDVHDVAGAGFSLGIAVTQAPGAAMTLRFVQADGVNAFLLGYADASASHATTELAAKDVIFRVSQACHVPELFWRANEAPSPAPLTSLWAMG
jgi:hypothetical protein